MKRLLCLVLLVPSLTSFAQPNPDTLWTRAYGGNSDDWGYSIVQTADGGYIIVGTTYSPGTTNYDVFLVKTDSSGDTLWTHKYGGVRHEEALAVEQTSDGGYYVAGQIGPFDGDAWNFFAMRTSSSGDSLWSRNYGGTRVDYCNSAQQTADGDFVLAGYSSSFHEGGGDYWLIKTAANGDSLWSHFYGGESTDECFCVQQTRDSGFILAGYSYSFGPGLVDAWLVKVGADGDSLWSRAYGGFGSDALNSVRQTPDGGYILGGWTDSFGAGGADYWLIKTNSNGDSLWSHTYGGHNNDLCSSVELTADGGYIMAGHTASSGPGQTDFWLVKTDANGDSLWSRTFGGSNRDECSSVVQTNDRGYVLAGRTYSIGVGTPITSNFYVVKTGTDHPSSVEISSPLPNDFQIHPNYPNPFNPTTTISFSLLNTSKVTLDIFDVTGRRVTTLINQTVQSGEHHTMFDGTELPSGIYFARLTIPQQQATQKLLLVK